MTTTKYRATIEFEGYPPRHSLPPLDERIRRCLETHPTLSFAVQQVRVEELKPLGEGRTCPSCSGELTISATLIGCHGCGAEWGRINGRWIEIQERCPGEDACHGPLKDCLKCGDVRYVCGDPDCDAHWIVHHPAVHLLTAGQAGCAGDTGLEDEPAKWPPGHTWTAAPTEVTCEVCKIGLGPKSER